MSRVLCTLDPNRCDGAILLSQGFTVATNNAVVDYNRKVLGTLAFAAGRIAFECTFWSNSRPKKGPTNLASVGVVSAQTPITGAYVGGDTVTSVVDGAGLRPSDGATTPKAGLYRGNSLVGSTFDACFERQVIGVLLDNTLAAPTVSFQVNGSYSGQVALTAGLFYLPAVSIGCSASAGDISAFLNFGQYRFEYPNFWINE
jgi:hypothetical protein